MNRPAGRAPERRIFQIRSPGRNTATVSRQPFPRTSASEAPRWMSRRQPGAPLEKKAASPVRCGSQRPRRHSGMEWHWWGAGCAEVVPPLGRFLPRKERKLPNRSRSCPEASFMRRIEQARWTKPRNIAVDFSHRVHSPRQFCSHPIIRSTVHLRLQRLEALPSSILFSGFRVFKCGESISTPYRASFSSIFGS